MGGGRNHACVAGGGSKISTEQVLLPGQGGHRVLAAGAQVCGSGLPRGRPPKTSGSTGVPHRRACLGKEVEVPQKKNKILDSSNHLLSPDSSSNIHPSPSRAGCRSSTRLPAGARRPGRGQGRAGGVAFTLVARGASRAAGRAQSRRGDCQPAPPPPKKKTGQAPPCRGWGKDWEPFQEPLAVARAARS